MAILRALRISQNGKPGTIFEATGYRVKQLTEGDSPIAEIYDEEKAELDELDAELDAPVEEKAADAAPETQAAPAPANKGGKKPKKASKK